MVSSQKVSQLKQLYKEYLKKTYPEWSVRSVRTHCSDAFYLVNHNITIDFWECLLDDQAVEAAYQDILYSLKEEAQVKNAKQRAKRYGAELKRLKGFLDEVYTGVKHFAGEELIAKQRIYIVAKDVWQQRSSRQAAAMQLSAELKTVSSSSCETMITALAAFLTGTRLETCLTISLAQYFLAQIALEFGTEQLRTALMVMQEAIVNHYQKKGGSWPRMRLECHLLASQAQLPLEFGMRLFDRFQSVAEERVWLFRGHLENDLENDSLQRKGTLIWELKPNQSKLTAGDLVYLWQTNADSGCIACGRITRAPQVQMKLADEYALLEEHYQEFLVVEIELEKNDQVRPLTLEQLLQVACFKDLPMLYVAGVEVELLDSMMAGWLKCYLAAAQLQPAAYTKEQFLETVFLDEQQLEDMIQLLQYKQNLILEGPPGVGKTFLAKRLAYLRMGQQDHDRVLTLQFHQSYSYEDFVGGFRPTATGFALTWGPFYQFCKRAAGDKRDYYLLIDEINRGNLNQIFGELLLLLDVNQRGPEHQIKLLYGEELFYVPKNLYLIGMMNTADRGLALLDYAMRRRFAFYPLSPAFANKQFKQQIENAKQPQVTALVTVIEQLNQQIASDPALGRGYAIGHSYVCQNDVVTAGWIRYVVEYELIPLLREYWFDQPHKVREWAKRLQEVYDDSQ